MGKFWIRPSIGLFFGLANANKDKDAGGGGLVLGGSGMSLQVGGLLGAIVGVGEKWGIYSGLNGALALLPLLGFGFIGVPLGFHWKKKWCFGVIIPIWMTEWWVGLLIGLAAFFFAWLLSSRSS